MTNMWLSNTESYKDSMPLAGSIVSLIVAPRWLSISSLIILAIKKSKLGLKANTGPMVNYIE